MSPRIVPAIAITHFVILVSSRELREMCMPPRAPVPNPDTTAHLTFQISSALTTTMLRFVVRSRLVRANVYRLVPVSCRSVSSWEWASSNQATTNSRQDSSSNRTPQPIAVDPKIQTQVLDKCEALHSSIMPLNENLRGPLAKHSDKGTALPFVLLVGNHSSGKSSFINYVLGRNVQTAGVAPTDDAFTVIAPGPNDTDQDGPALIGDPDMGFSGLRQFGPTLIHHTQLKVRKDIQTHNFMLIDSPGMIDSPASSMSVMKNERGDILDRGYDFAGVVKWLAERADVVLLFFDPDKPGTTGETLNILLHSLAGMDHKLLIVLNKADQFKKIHDFARAYGSLCWNLSKVIPRKDLPRIFTMCLPVKSNSTLDMSEPSPPLQLEKSGLADLHQTRHDVVEEVMKAPKRRIDNVITHLNDSVHLLLMHARIVEEIRRAYSKRKWDQWMQQGSALVLGAGVSSISVYASLPVEATSSSVVATVLGVGGMIWFQSSQLQAYERELVQPSQLSFAFQRTYAREVSEEDEYIESVWHRIRDPMRLGLETMGLSNVPSVSKGELDELQSILDNEIPRLRQLASPTHFGTRRGGAEQDVPQSPAQ